MNILIATDGTGYSKTAVQMVSKLALIDTDSILIVTVIDMAIPSSLDIYSGYFSPNLEIEKAVQENADKVIVESVEEIRTLLPSKNIKLSTRILFGSPERRIVETAEEINADLIIVGSHGYNSWERLLLGSVSDSVVHHAPCSVLIVRSPDAQQQQKL